MIDKKYQFHDLTGNLLEGTIRDKITTKDTRDGLVRSAYLVELSAHTDVPDVKGTFVTIFPEFIVQEVPAPKMEFIRANTSGIPDRKFVNIDTSQDVTMLAGPDNPAAAYWGEVRAHNRFIFLAAMICAAALFIGFYLGVHHGR